MSITLTVVEHRAHARDKMTARASNTKYGINLIGHISARIGLGVSARGVIRAIMARGIDVAILDLDPGGGRHRADNSFQSLTVQTAKELPSRTNLWLIPPHSIAAHTNELKELLRPGCINAGFVMWELPTIPEADRLVLELLDVAISGSDFIRHAIDFSTAGIRTIRGLQPVYLPAEVHKDRVRFALPHDAVIYVFSFEPLSCIERKNPLAVLRAFLNSVGGDPRAHLVIKVNNAQRSGTELPAVAALREVIGAHPRITIVAENLDYTGVLSLFASCDVYVSLHRAEGFGLGMLEAMLLGKPVIATAWSGNMTFMRDTNACLVGYKLIPTRGSVMQYRQPYIPKGTMWADPSVEEAGAWMWRLLNDENLRRSKGDAARRDAQAYCAEAEQCGFIEELLELARNMDPKEIAARRKDLQSRLRRIHKIMNPVTASEIAKTAWRSIRAPLDRHVFWRFKAENRLDR